MRRITLVLALAALLALGIGSVSAQATPEATPPAEGVAYVPPISLPSSARLSGFRPIYQLFNRCAAAALTMQLSYFGWQGTYYQTIHALNPNADDVAVRLDEMAAFAEQQGLKAVYRSGGTLDLLKALVASGFPVLVKNAYYEGANTLRDFMGHNRIVMGYDDNQQEFYTFDSLLGDGPGNTGRPLSYTDLDSKWRPFNRVFLVLYRPEDESKIQQVMGDYWDPAYANQYALQQAQQAVSAPQPDSFDWFNLGTSLVALERYPEAAAAFDQASKIGLPWRMLWYQYGPFEAYYQVGRYDDLMRLAHSVIATTPGVEESYYYLGLAYEAQGDLLHAKADFEAALWQNINFAPAQAALKRVGG